MNSPVDQQFDAVALEYDFMAETFHSPDFLSEQRPSRNGLALDLGCGSGLTVQTLAEHFQRVIGIDLSPELLSIAQAKRHPSNVLYCQMDISQLGLAGEFDYIVSANVFHHLDNIPDVLTHLKKLVKPGGRLILVDVVSPRETPPPIVYIVGALLEFLPNLRKYGWKIANRIFRFRVSKHWLTHLATDHYLSQDTFQRLYSEHLPNCVFPRPGCLIWDKPITDPPMTF